MTALLQCIRGQFSTRMLYCYVTALCVTFWGLIFLAWLGYREHKYSI